MATACRGTHYHASLGANAAYILLITSSNALVVSLSPLRYLDNSCNAVPNRNRTVTFSLSFLPT